MKNRILMISIFLFVFTGIAFGQNMTVKDSEANTLMEVEDKGTSGALSVSAVSTDSVEINSMGAAPGKTSNKLYNVSGSLYWNGSAIGMSGSAGGWTDSGTNVYLSTASDNVGIGTSSPSQKLDVRGDIITGVDGYGGTLRLAATDATNEGGQIVWNGAGSYDYWVHDIFQNKMRIFTNSANNNQVNIYNAGSGTTGLSVDGSVGIGTNNPDAKLDIQGTLNVGVDDTGYDVNFYGAYPDSRMFWDESKMAFRTGRATGTEWDDANVGTYSFAMGLGTTASGNYSTAMGIGTTASGVYSTATGYNTDAESYMSTAIGKYNVGGGNATTWVDTDPLFEIGIGTGDVSRDNAMTVLKNGNVGIGTNNPASELEVDGTISASEDLVVTGSAVIEGNRIGFHAYNSTTDPIVGSSAQVEFDTEIFDDGACFDNVNDIFVVPVDGVYHFSTMVLMDYCNATTGISVSLLKNGSLIARLSKLKPDSSIEPAQYGIGGSITLKLEADDEIEVWAVGDSEFNIRGDSDFSGVTWFSGHLVYR